ncbi:ABC transporter permease subunit [Phenylobacterium sp. LjRoot225]|uniref:ABC transporter permease n=1 Tax=Phenylobacterium sp. LjRoot225 TaxID=3342285 RepID=UPI003ED105E9
MTLAVGLPRMAEPRRWRASGALKAGGARLVAYAAFLAAILILWFAANGVFGVPTFLLPSPAQALTAFLQNADEIGSATAFTLGCTVAGLAVSLVLAVVLAVLFTLSSGLDRALTPLVLIVRTVPVIAVAPLLVMLWGRGRWNSIGVVALLTFFQLMLAAKRGLQAPTANLMEMMWANGASFWQTLLKVRLPFALPFLFTGLRLAAHSAILSAMFAEWLSGAPGLGYLMLDAYSQQNFALMWSAILVSTTVAYLFFTVTIMLERAVADRSA